MPVSVVYIVGRLEPGSNALAWRGPGISLWGAYFAFGYIGQAEQCDDRHAQHHREPAFIAFGANAALVLRESSKPLRYAIETDIRQQYDPPLNRQ